MPSVNSRPSSPDSVVISGDLDHGDARGRHVRAGFQSPIPAIAVPRVDNVMVGSLWYDIGMCIARLEFGMETLPDGNPRWYHRDETMTNIYNLNRLRNHDPINDIGPWWNIAICDGAPTTCTMEYFFENYGVEVIEIRSTNNYDDMMRGIFEAAIGTWDEEDNRSLFTQPDN